MCFYNDKKKSEAINGDAQQQEWGWQPTKTRIESTFKVCQFQIPAF
jgi:hypothetical protein